MSLTEPSLCFICPVVVFSCITQAVHLIVSCLSVLCPFSGSFVLLFFFLYYTSSTSHCLMSFCLMSLQLMGSFVLAVGLWLRFDPETVSLLNGDKAPDTFFIGEYSNSSQCGCLPTVFNTKALDSIHAMNNSSKVPLKSKCFLSSICHHIGLFFLWSTARVCFKGLLLGNHSEEAKESSVSL